jgi:hypothetical protein
MKIEDELGSKAVYAGLAAYPLAVERFELGSVRL